MAAGQNGHHGVKLVHLVGTMLRRGTVFALIRHRYMVVPTAVGSQRKQKIAILLHVQVIIIIASDVVLTSTVYHESVCK